MRGCIGTILVAGLSLAASDVLALDVTGAYVATNTLSPISGAYQFGLSVAIFGEEAMTVAPNVTTGPILSSGAAVIYRINRIGEWIEEDPELSDPQPKTDLVSYLPCNAISMGTDRIALGAPSEADNQGAVIVYTREASVWHLRFLADKAGVKDDQFGCGVAISGDYVVVGSPGHDSTGVGYVYVNSGSDWSLQATLLPTDASSGAQVGLTAAMDGDTVALGAPHDNFDRGAVYVFKRVGTAWSQHKLIAVDGAAGDAYGASVAISNGTIIVGAPNHAANRGAAYVYAGATYALQKELTSPKSAVSSYFGSSVAIDGDRTIIGEMGAGAAYAYARFGNRWKLRGTFADFTSSRFGGSVGTSGGRVIIGAIAESDGFDIGLAHVLEDDTIFTDDYE